MRVFLIDKGKGEETIDRSDALVKDCTLSSKEIVDKIAAAGIVGLGGATFPTQVKLRSTVHSSADKKYHHGGLKDGK